MVEIFKSQKNKDQVEIDNYIYEEKRKCRNYIKWRCINKQCNSTVTSSLNFKEELNSFILKRSHNHEPDTQLCIRKKLIIKMKNLIVNTNDSPRNVVFSVIRGAQIDTISALGSFDNIYRVLRKHRQNAINPLPYQFPQLKLSSNLAITHNNNIFYQYGPDNFRGLEENADILLFFSDDMISKLSTNKIWCVDGTFSVVPSPYMQLYTISYLKDNNVFPCVFAILKNKRQVTYNKMLELIQHLQTIEEPECIKVDFEKASINALKLAFPNARISGCMFHLGQAILRKIKDLSIFSLYKSSIIMKKFVKALLALSFVKRTEITCLYNLLRNSDDFPEFLLPVYDYFYDTFLNVNDNCPYPPELWNSDAIIDRNIPRTNNSIEGWHNVFLNTFGTSKFSLHLLIQRLKNEQDVIRIRSIQKDILNMNFQRKKKYELIENNLNEFLIRNIRSEYNLIFVFSLVDLLFY